MTTLAQLGVDARPFAGNEVGEYRAGEIGVSGLMVTPGARHIDQGGRLAGALVPVLREPAVLLLMLKELPVGDAVLEQLATLPNLVGLNLLGTRVTEHGLSRLDQLRGLRNIELPTHAGDEALRSLSRAGRVRGIFAPRNTRITDEGLHALRSLRLEILHLPRSAIGDAGLEALRDQGALQLLNLEGTRVSDRGLDALGSLAGLRQLDLRATGVRPAGLSALRAALPDCAIRA